MTVHHEGHGVTVHHGDCLDVLRGLGDSSVDAVVTDPPYGLSGTSPAQVADTITRWVSGDRTYTPQGAGFMGKDWDAFVPPVAVWDECLRVLKPGGHALVFAGSRTVDLMTLGLRLAGFEIRDSIAWVQSQGFPKSLDVSKAVDAARGAERRVVATGPTVKRMPTGADDVRSGDRVTATEEAATWKGWGTGLRPSFEPVVVARKPLGGPVAANVLAHGTGALHIDACRTPLSREDTERYLTTREGWHRHDTSRGDGTARAAEVYGTYGVDAAGPHDGGRWPANVALDSAAAAYVDTESGKRPSGGRLTGSEPSRPFRDTYGVMDGRRVFEPYTDTGGASRFFPVFPGVRYEPKATPEERPRSADGVAHPTVKPVELIRWLVRLVTPPGGVVLDPFAGSGTTAEACLIEGVQCVTVERDAQYLPLIVERIHRQRDPLAYHRAKNPDDLGLFADLGD